jgi:phosphodiesterase/alkaline phosphatase D-like protein
MPDLIVGPTTESTARIWVRGDERHDTCDVLVRADGSEHARHIDLDEATDYTGVVDFVGLKPGRAHSIVATFSADADSEVHGAFHTFAERRPDKEFTFSFVLSSCNLSVISINNLLAFLLASSGSAVASSSLDIPLERWRFPAWTWLRRLLRFVLKPLLYVVAAAIQKATDIKQPGPPYIRSPFLKLSAVFDSLLLTIEGLEQAPAVGDAVRAGSARGLVASTPTTLKEKTGERSAIRQLVLAQVEGRVHEQSVLGSDDGTKSYGRIVRVESGRQWYDRPSFFIHAGDQIYYDFPHETRPPDRKEYRMSYREAWFDDGPNRHMLAHWPHYMTLDDHDIADQFSCDFNPPAPTATADAYVREAMVAYREYSQSRDPIDQHFHTASPSSGPYWYCFEKGGARFFVLDTRTARHDHGPAYDGHHAEHDPRDEDKPRDDGEIIDEIQLCSLLRWMTTFKNDLKFVVTSVPFVAEIDDDASRSTARWQDVNDRNPLNDKWSAGRFRRQREIIIDHIAHECIERLVFLTGDMHCCYHASMTIEPPAASLQACRGGSAKYGCTTIHELAGGPVNQLQLARLAEFKTRHADRTCRGFSYSVCLDRFHSEVNAVMHVRVSYVCRRSILHEDRAIVPEIEWTVIRTLTANPAGAWQKDSAGSPRSAIDDEPTMRGRISFVEKRTAADLRRWR